MSFQQAAASLWRRRASRPDTAPAFPSSAAFSELVSKRCTLGGRWEGKPGGAANATMPWGYTDYSVCLRDEIAELFRDLYSGGLASGEVSAAAEAAAQQDSANYIHFYFQKQ